MTEIELLDARWRDLFGEPPVIMDTDLMRDILEDLDSAAGNS